MESHLIINDQKQEDLNALFLETNLGLDNNNYSIFLIKLALENFRKFEKLVWKHIQRTHAIMGANGVSWGKTTLLWALLLFYPICVNVLLS
jgi:putative ribosome biogenesis GTPase RsgA